MKKIIFTLFLLSVLPTFSQKWSRGEVEELDLSLFNATHVFALPTSETLSKNDFYFMMGHRFQIPVSSGLDDLYGFDGGVVMRIALAYAPTDNLMLNIGRSNLEDNYDFQAKYKTFQIKNDVAPTLISFMAGGAYNAEPNQELPEDSRKWQGYAFAIANTMLFDKIGIGVAPGFLYNSNCACIDVQNSWVLGTYLQYFIDDHWSIVGEYTPTLNGWTDGYDSIAFGAELEYGGHFFKFFLTNNTKTNLSQFMAGSINPIGFNDLHFSFQITRNL